MQLLSFLRKAIWPVFLCVGMVAVLGCFYYCYSNEAAGAIEIMKQTVFGHALLTLTFMMMGIELRRELSASALEEVTAAYQRRPWALPLAQLLALAILAAAVTAILVLGFLLPMWMDGVPTLWRRQTALYAILLFFLPSVALGYWGLFLAQVYPRKNVYLPAVVVWFLTSSLLVYYTGMISATDYLPRLLINFFNMGFNNYQMYQNLVTGARIELPRWVVRLGFGLFLGGLYLVCYSYRCASTRGRKTRARACIGCVAVGGVAVLALLCTRYSVFFTRFADDFHTQILTYLESRESLSETVPVSAEYPAQKNVTLVQTAIDLTCTTQGLQGEVTMTATADAEIDRQSFTLFSDFAVDEVLVDGVAASFARDYNALMVYFPEEKNQGQTVVFTFSYHGYTLPSYPVNETTVQLNRAFPWIPWPGITPVSEAKVDNYTYSEAFYIDPWQRGDVVEYTLTYHGPGNLCTNLQQVDDHTYAGISDDGVSLYSGMLHTVYRGVDAYVPAALYRYRTVCVDAVLDMYDVLLDYCQRFGAPVEPQLPTSITVVQMEYPSCGRIVNCANELYAWSDAWEIRASNEFPRILWYREWMGSADSYRASCEIQGELVAALLLNPSVGYPVDADAEATSCFSDLLACSIQSREWDDETRQQYARQMCGAYFEGNEDLEQAVDRLFQRMQAGESFDPALAELYQLLLQSQAVAPEDMVLALLENAGG